MPPWEIWMWTEKLNEEFATHDEDPAASSTATHDHDDNDEYDPNDLPGLGFNVRQI